MFCQAFCQGGDSMEPKGFRRKLTAILSADVAGYSRLMQDDEAATVKILEAYKQIISDLVKQHRGRVVDSPGDNLLAEFASVVDAVQCAVATQKELQARNTELPDNRKMLFRIGVNLGDVIEEGSRIYGDGVNIAARLESLSDPGGICVSKTAFDQIETKLPFGYEFLGEQTVKNITKPVGAYRVVLEPRVTKAKSAETKALKKGRRTVVTSLIAVLVLSAAAALWQFFLQPAATPPATPVEKADPKQMALPLPEQPSIAVLPFVNLSEDPKHELLCDGITDNIINALSKVPRLFVIARNSTFTYKGKAVKAKQVSEELGVRYVLEGSVQRSGNRVRISAQLVDALTGHPLLAERYDGETTDLFTLQDDITMKVLGAVRVKFEGLGTSAWIKYYKGTKGLDCFLKYQEATSYIQRMTTSSNNQARQIAEEGRAICPESIGFYRLLAIVNLNDYQLGSSKNPRESIEKADKFLQQALAIDDTNAEVYGNLSQVYTRKREYDKAIEAAERGVTLDPGSSWALYRYGLALNFAGRSEEAIPLFEKAIRLNPLGPAAFYFDYGMALRNTGRLDEAVASLKKAIERAPNWFWSHAALASTYSMLDRDEDAHAEASEVLRINPRFSLEWVAKVASYKDRSWVDKFIDTMRKAGLPDKPPPAQP
jgi:adenylate cyclase